LVESEPLCIYKYEDYLKHVTISSNGAIIVGKNILIDGFSEKPIRIVTHAHADHVRGLEDSLRYSKYILASPITLDLVEALGYVSRDLVPLLRRKSVPLDYHQVYTFNGDKVEFYKSDHVPGSVQVLVKLRDSGITIGYTGDFKLTNKTEILENTNVLITEATYGNPMHIRRFKDSIPQILVDLVLEGLSRYKRVYIYAYHGKIQEVMSILRDNEIKHPFVLPRKIYRATKILEQRYGFNYGRYYCDDELGNLRNDRFLVFKHFNSAKNRRLDGNGLHIVLTGRCMLEPLVKADEYTYIVAFSDHADFSELVKYIELSNSELVVIDGSRSDNAEFLKKALLERGYCAVTLP